MQWVANRTFSCLYLTALKVAKLKKSQPIPSRQVAPLPRRSVLATVSGPVCVAGRMRRRARTVAGRGWWPGRWRDLWVPRSSKQARNLMSLLLPRDACDNAKKHRREIKTGVSRTMRLSYLGLGLLIHYCGVQDPRPVLRPLHFCTTIAPLAFVLHSTPYFCVAYFSTVTKEGQLRGQTKAPYYRSSLSYS